jgi:hypothetical protein
MNDHDDFSARRNRRFGSPMWICTLTAVLCLLATGCQKKMELPAPATQSTGVSVEKMAESSATPAPAPTTAESNPAPSGAPAAASLSEFESSTELADLTKELRIFVLQKKRLPADVNELARASGFKPPTPPAGHKLVIDKETKSVKAVQMK